MLLSLIKILAFVIIVTALTYGALMLTSVEGGAVVQVAGIELTLTPLQLVFAFVALIIAVWLLLKILAFFWAAFRFLNGDETAISRYFDRNRERKGFEALSEGMVALAAGEGHLAMAKARRADKYLLNPELTTLLTAQAAELSGDRRTAENSYKKLLTSDQTRFVGVRGLMRQRLADGDTDKALALAEKAFGLKPKHEETQDVLLRLQAEKEDWAGARRTLGAKLKSGNMPRNVHKRRDAVLALSEAKDVMESGKTIQAREAAIEANRLSPDLVPAAVMAADAHIQQGKPKYATRVLTKAWNVHPHPDLAAAFARIEPDEKPDARLKRFKTLTKQNPEHPESQMLLCELNIAAEDFPAARKALGHLVVDDPTARSLTLMAAIERGEGADDAVVRGWLTKALGAPRGPQWVCDNCNHVHTNWTPVCTNCASVDTLSWKRPPEGEVAMPMGTEMLPLIVGQTAAPEVAAADPATALTVADAEVIPPETTDEK
jgi:HemY protein